MLGNAWSILGLAFLTLMLWTGPAQAQTPPDVDIELGLSVGGHGPLQSSQAALGSLRGDETGAGVALAMDVGLTFPGSWISTRLLLDLGLAALNRDILRGTNAPPIQNGTRIGFGLSLDLRPPQLGWTPFGRFFGGFAWLLSDTREGGACPNRGDDFGQSDFDRARCQGEPRSFIEYRGIQVGASLGLGYRSLLLRTGRVGTIDFEVRYALSDWYTVRFETASGEEVRSLQVDGVNVPLGEGPSALHQVMVLVTARIGLLQWE